MRVTVTAPPPRVPVTVTPPRAMTHRPQMITQEYPVEDSRCRDEDEINNKHPLKHMYPIRITQMSQKINQVESAAPIATMHQHWMMIIHEQLHTTTQLIDNYLKVNACKLPQTMTHNDYITQVSNIIIDDDTGK